MAYFLGIMLLAGMIFLFITPQKSKKQKSSLKTKALSISDIKGLILLASTKRPDVELEKILAYKILEMFSGQQQAGEKNIWLVSDSNFSDNSSYQNALKLKDTFQTEYIRIEVEDVKDIDDPDIIFAKINSIYNFAKHDIGIDENEIVCDCTGGSKIMTIGMALASMGGRRLVYFDKSDNYVEIDTKYLFESMLEGLK